MKTGYLKKRLAAIVLFSGYPFSVPILFRYPVFNAKYILGLILFWVANTFLGSQFSVHKGIKKTSLTSAK